MPTIFVHMYRPVLFIIVHIFISGSNLISQNSTGYNKKIETFVSEIQSKTKRCIWVRISNHNPIIGIYPSIIVSIQVNQISRFGVIQFRPWIIIYLFVILEHTICFVSIKISDRISFLCTIDRNKIRNKGTSLAINITFIISDTGHLVLIDTHIKCCSIVETSNMIIPVKRKFYTIIFHISPINIRSTSTVRGQNRSLYKPIFRLFLIPIKSKAQTPVKET